MPAGAFQTLRQAIAEDGGDARRVFGEETGEGEALSALGTALASDGAILTLRDGQTVVLNHHGDAHVRHDVSVEMGAATLIELHGGAQSLSHAGMHVRVAPGAKLTHIQVVTSAGQHLGGVAVDVDHSGTYDLTLLAAGPALLRQDVLVRFEDEAAQARIRGVLLAANDEHLDLHARVEHGEPNGTSETQVRAVAIERGRVAAQSLVRVAPHARKTDARQLIRGLVLGDKAEIDAKPELEILNDDVKCAHGTALGDLDPEAVFYLRSRGVPETEARALLIEAFLAELIDQAPHEGARELLLAHVGAGSPHMQGKGRPMAEGTRHLAFDVAKVRADFPILARQIHGVPLVYLDSAASAQKPRAVIEKLKATMEHSYANVHRGLHTLANETTEAYEAARARVARFVNAREPSELIFTRGSTEAINLAAASWGGANIGAGDEIVLSLLEHHSNIVPWHFLRERKGAVIKWVPISDDGAFDLAAFEKLLGPRAKLVAVTHMSNALGTMPPVKDIVRLAHAAGAKVLIDGSQGAVHLKADVQDLGCDFYALTGHKIYGPTGVGALWARRELLEAMPPYQGGGEMIETVSTERVIYGPVPQKFEAGTPPILEAIGLHAAIDYVEGLGREAIQAHEARLIALATERLRSLNSVRLFGTAEPKGSILSFAVEGAHAHDVATILDRQGIAVRAGTHCAEPLMKRLGVTSTARASFALYNTEEEVETLTRGVEKAISLLR